MRCHRWLGCSTIQTFNYSKMRMFSFPRRITSLSATPRQCDNQQIIRHGQLINISAEIFRSLSLRKNAHHFSVTQTTLKGLLVWTTHRLFGVHSMHSAFDAENDFCVKTGRNPQFDIVAERMPSDRPRDLISTRVCVFMLFKLDHPRPRPRSDSVWMRSSARRTRICLKGNSFPIAR